MYEMAKKAREAMRGKAQRLAGEKDSKTDSSDWSPAEPLNADVKTGMRPISKRAYKKGGKVEGEKAMTHAGRKARKSGGRAITADSLINRDQKEANEEREGKKHIGGMKKGGRAKKALGGMPADALKGTMNPAAVLQAVRNATMGMKKGGRSERKAGGNVNYGPMEMPAGKKGASLKEQEAIAKHDQDLSKPKRGKAVNKEGGGGLSTYGATSAAPAGADNRGDMVKKNAMNFGPGAPGSPYKKGGMAKHEDIAEDKKLIREMVKPAARTGKAEGGAKKYVNIGGKRVEDTPEAKLANVKKTFPNATAVTPEGHPDWEKMGVNMPRKTGGRTKKYGGGGISGLNMGPAKAYGGERSDKPKAAKKGMNVAITINTQPQPGADMMAGMAGMPGLPPGMPPGMPPRPPGGVPVPMGMPPGGAPPAPAPQMAMAMPPMAPPGGGMPPMARKAGGKVYRSYKDMDAGAGSGLGRLEKTEIQKRKA